MTGIGKESMSLRGRGLVIRRPRRLKSWTEIGNSDANSWRKVNARRGKWVVGRRYDSCGQHLIAVARGQNGAAEYRKLGD